MREPSETHGSDYAILFLTDQQNGRQQRPLSNPQKEKELRPSLRDPLLYTSTPAVSQVTMVEIPLPRFRAANIHNG
jgi:hypothetical protein